MLGRRWEQSLVQDPQLLTVLTTLARAAVQRSTHSARWARVHSLLDLDPEIQSWVNLCEPRARSPRAPWLVGISGTGQT